MLRKYAQEISESTAGVIGYDVFVTDVEGIIIGCSNPERGLYTLHEASLRAIQTKIGYAEDEEDAKRFRGTNPGVTYPIEEPSGQVVGTIAITGEPSKVAPFALIVKKQAEILLREKLLFEAVLNQERTLQSLIQEIRTFNPEMNNEKPILEKARSFGFDDRLSYVVIAVEIFGAEAFEHMVREDFGRNSRMGNPELVIQSMKNKVLNYMKTIFNQVNDIVTTVGNNRYVILRAIYPRYSIDENQFWVILQDECKQVGDVLAGDGLSASVGIGSISKGIVQLSSSYHQAWQAIMLGKTLHGKSGIYKIHDYRIEDLLTTANLKLIKQFIEEELAEIKNQSDADELNNTIKEWCNSGFNTGQTADALHIHRNTLDYRLKKIERISGNNPREFRQIIKLYFAIQLDCLFGEDDGSVGN